MLRVKKTNFSIQEYEGLAVSYNEQGYANLLKKNFIVAINLYTTAIQFAQKTNNQKLFLEIENNLALAYNRYGISFLENDRLEEAAAQLRIANQLATDPSSRRIIFNNLANAVWALECLKPQIPTEELKETKENFTSATGGEPIPEFPSPSRAPVKLTIKFVNEAGREFSKETKIKIYEGLALTYSEHAQLFFKNKNFVVALAQLKLAIEALENAGPEANIVLRRNIYNDYAFLLNVCRTPVVSPAAERKEEKQSAISSSVTAHNRFFNGTMTKLSSVPSVAAAANERNEEKPIATSHNQIFKPTMTKLSSVPPAPVIIADAESVNGLQRRR